MKPNYFQRVAALTPTKFWVNNVTVDEARRGIAAGATGCTQNPSYTWKMLSRNDAGDYPLRLLGEALAESDDDNEVQCILQRKLVKLVSDEFMTLWEASNGRYGYVSIQGDPIHEEDPEVIINEARLSRQLNPNIMVKIPATSAGLQAMEVLIREDVPLNATEAMGLSQVIALCEMYETVTHETGRNPVMYYSLITGIFDEWLSLDTQKQGIEINPDVLYQAGMVIARKVYQEVHDRGYRLGFIGGGVRGLQHFTEMVGADACITMNWTGACDKLIELDQPVISRFFNPVQPRVLEELLARVPEFARAYYADGLTVEEFGAYGPVEYFRESFVSSWTKALKFISDHRNR